jgi:hypothetical protein
LLKKNEGDYIAFDVTGMLEETVLVPLFRNLSGEFLECRSAGAVDLLSRQAV